MGNIGNLFHALRSTLLSAASIIAALGVITSSASVVIAVEGGTGSSALADALADERDAQNDVRLARDKFALEILEAVCTQESELCASTPIRNSLEAAIQHGIAVGTRLTIDGETADVRGPADLPEPSFPNLENLLIIAIVACITDSLPVEASIVHDALQRSEYFGSPHKYAGLVWALITNEVTRKSMEASPGLIEKPKWWRDWLLGFGVALGGVMVGGAAAWRLAELRQQLLQQGAGGPQNP